MSPVAKDVVAKTLESGFIGQGERYNDLEKLLSSKTGKKPLLLNSCTSALALALRLAEVGPGDYVISTPMTCSATNSVIALETRANILWADTDPITGNICPKSVEKLMNHNPTPKAIMAVNWAGRYCDFPALKKHGIPVIEDAAHNMVSKSPWGEDSGDYVCYSLQAIKFWTSGDGGVLFTPEDKFDLGYKLMWYGLDRRIGASFRCSQDIDELGYKYHMNDISASIALANYELAASSRGDHISNAITLWNELKDLKTITIPECRIPTCDYWIFSILVEKDTKEDFISHLMSRGIDCNPVHRRNDTFTCFSKFKSSDPSPGLDNFSSKQVAIPCGWWLTSKDVECIVKAVKSY